LYNVLLVWVIKEISCSYKGNKKHYRAFGGNVSVNTLARTHTQNTSAHVRAHTHNNTHTILHTTHTCAHTQSHIHARMHTCTHTHHTHHTHTHTRAEAEYHISNCRLSHLKLQSITSQTTVILMCAIMRPSNLTVLS